MDNKQLASIILGNAGGKDNVSQVVHCATRPRFRLRDESIAKTDVLKSTPGVLSVINAGSIRLSSGRTCRRCIRKSWRRRRFPMTTS